MATERTVDKKIPFQATDGAVKTAAMVGLVDCAVVDACNMGFSAGAHWRSHPGLLTQCNFVQVCVNPHIPTNCF